MSTPTHATQSLYTAITQIEVMMLVTITSNQQLRARPMQVQQVDHDCTLWFFINRTSPLATELRQYQQVSLTSAHDGDQAYLALSGKAWLVDDQSIVEAMWQPAALTWFPKGMTDPALCLLRVDAHSAERWDHGKHEQISIQG